MRHARESGSDARISSVAKEPYRPRSQPLTNPARRKPFTMYGHDRIRCHTSSER